MFRFNLTDRAQIIVAALGVVLCAYLIADALTGGYLLSAQNAAEHLRVYGAR